MRATTTIILVLLLAAGWGAWQWISLAAAAAPPPIGQPLVRFSAQDVTEIQLRRTEASANLNPIDGVWHFTFPLVDRVDPTAALALYLGLNGLVLQEIIPHREWRDANRQLEEFGLGRKAVRVRLIGTDKKTLHEFRLGEVTPWETDGEPTMYLQWKTGPVPEDVLVVGGNLRSLLDRPFDALRARQALHLPRPPLAISLQQGEQRLDLARARPDQAWHITRPLAERANPEAVDALLRALSTTEATALLPRDPAPLAGPVVARLAITMQAATPAADGTSATPAAGDAPTRIEADFHASTNGEPGEMISRWSDRRYDLRLPAASMDWLKPDLNRFRARTLGDYDPARTMELLIRDPGGTGSPVVLRQEKDSWEIYLRDRWHPADAARVQRAILALTTCPLQGFPTDSLAQPERYGLDEPVLQVALLDASGTREKLSFGRKDGKVFVRRDNGLSVYQVPDSVIPYLPDLPAAWRSRQLFDFAAIDLRQIVVQPPGQAPVTLRYNAHENLWIAAIDGKDATARLDVAAAANLASALERLQANSWLSGSDAAVASALAAPTASLALTMDTFTEDGSPGPLRRLRLEFAPTGEGAAFLYGRFADEPDVFLLEASTLANLLGNLFLPEE